MVRAVTNMDEVVEEIMVLHRSLPPRPSMEEVETALSVIENVENTKSTRLQMMTRRHKPVNVPVELFEVLQEMQRNQIEFQAEEEMREALAMLDLEDRHRLFDYLLRKASNSLPSSSNQSDELDAPVSVKTLAKINVTGADFTPKITNYGELDGGLKHSKDGGFNHSRDDGFIRKPKPGIADGVLGISQAPSPRNRLVKSRLPTLEENSSFKKASAIAVSTDTDAEGGQKLSLIKLASLIEITAKGGAEKLDLQGKLMDQVEWLPDSIGKLNNLTEIILSNNRIVTLPMSIKGFSKLKKLDIHANQLMNLPDSIGELSSLTDLDLHGNRLQTLPASVGKLSQLVSLDLSSNRLLSLPESVGQLSNLKRLSIETNEIEELPYTIGQCVALTELRADYNKLKALPEAVGKLESLQVLTLHYNRIKSLPSTMASLTNLKELDVSFNELESIPESLCLATNLVKLNACSNFADLRKLPRSIGNLVMLEELDISNDQINVLPDSFCMLTNLQILRAEETPLEIPPRPIVESGAKAVVQFMIDYVAKKDAAVKETKPKGRWSIFCSCLRKRKRAESNAQYIRAGS